MIHINDIYKTKPVLSESRVNIYLLQFKMFDHKTLLACLSEDEKVRADKLKVELKRNQFIITRAVLRVLLSNCIETKPEAITFHYEQHGKPYITDQYNNKTIEFNISHSGDYALIALTLGNKLGIDIEEMNSKIDYPTLSKRFFSEQENKALMNLKESNQLDAFYRTWVRKEAFIKAVGTGVAFGLDTFSVSQEEASETGLDVVVPDRAESGWYSFDLMDLDNYKLALTSSRKEIDIVISN